MEKNQLIDIILKRDYKNSKIINTIDKSGNDSKHYIVFFKDKDTDDELVLKIYLKYLIEEPSVLTIYHQYAILLNKFGIVTPKLVLNQDLNMYNIIEIEKELYIYWIEEYIPSKYNYPNLFPIYDMNLNVFYELGKINGKMNRISYENNVLSNHNLSMINFINPHKDWNYNSVRNILQKIKKTKKFVEKVNSIINLYHEKRKYLKRSYNFLKKGYVQGDISPANLIISIDDNNQHRILGLYDYNLSGNEIYLTDAINNGIFYAFEYLPHDRWIDKKLREINIPIMEERFNEYIKGYFSEFIDNNDKEYFDIIYNVLRPTRFKMGFLQEFLKNNNHEMIEYMLDWMMNEMQKTNVLK